MIGRESFEKVWLIKVATNRCRDIHRQRIRHPCKDLERVTAYCEMPEQSEVMKALLRLPDKLKIVIYPHYIEEYKCSEIAVMLGIYVQAVRKHLQMEIIQNVKTGIKRKKHRFSSYQEEYEEIRETAEWMENYGRKGEEVRIELFFEKMKDKEELF